MRAESTNARGVPPSLHPARKSLRTGDAPLRLPPTTLSKETTDGIFRSVTRGVQLFEGAGCWAVQRVVRADCGLRINNKQGARRGWWCFTSRLNMTPGQADPFRAIASRCTRSCASCARAHAASLSVPLYLGLQFLHLANVAYCAHDSSKSSIGIACGSSREPSDGHSYFFHLETAITHKHNGMLCSPDVAIYLLSTWSHEPTDGLCSASTTSRRQAGL